MNYNGVNNQMSKNESNGIITSRQCPTCGHHEIGYITNDGTFHPLKPGDRIQVLEQGHIPGRPSILQNMNELPIPEAKKEPTAYDIWVPEPIKSDPALCMKYGLLIPKDLLKEEISGAFYKIAYMQKIMMLIEKENFIPLPIILDRFFSAPNLATGSPKRIAETLIQELDEIRKPILQVKDWLGKQDMESLKKMVHPKSIESLDGQAMNDDQIRQALEELTLEEFFELL